MKIIAKQSKWFNQRKRSEAGDTIVEVLIIVVIISSVLGSAFVTTTRSLGNVQLSHEHESALKVSQSQLERLGSIGRTNTSAVHTIDHAFCLDANNVIVEFASTITTLPTATTNYPPECRIDTPQFGFNFLTGIVRVDNVFTAHTIWEDNSGDRQTVRLAYKLYPSAAVTYAPPGVGGFTPPTGPALPPPPPPPPGDPCFYYAVNDEGISNTQLLRIDPITRAVTNFGVDGHYDIEAFDLASDGYLYAIGGEDGGSNAGKLFRIDKNTGVYTLIGDTGDTVDASAASIRPTDNSYWVSREGEGLFRVNLSTGVQTKVSNDADSAEALAWNQAGSILYYISGNNLYAYNPGTNTSASIDSSVPKKAEGLDIATDGDLLMGVDDPSGINILKYNIASQNVVEDEIYNSTYNDIESVAYPASCPMY